MIIKYLKLILCKEKEIKSFKRYPLNKNKQNKFIKHLRENKSSKVEEFENVIKLYNDNNNPYLEKFLNETIWNLSTKL